MTRALVALFVLTLSSVVADKPACKVEKEKATKLQQEIQGLEAKLQAAESELQKLGAAGGATVQLSVLGAFASAKDTIGNAVQRALDNTDFDEKVSEKASEHFNNARSFSVDSFGKVTAIDYNRHVETVKQHDIYKTHVVPAMDTVSKKIDPYMIQYVHPAMETVTKETNRHVSTVKETYLPVVQDRLSQIPALFGQLESKLLELMTPVFGVAAKAFPSHGKMLPSGGVDRVLFLVVCIVLTYYFLFVAKFVVLTTLRVTSKTTTVAFKLAVVLPLKIVAKVLGILTCFATCFYCCGLCRRKQVAKDASKDTKKGKGAESKEKKQTEKATTEELIQLLEASKKKGKIDDAVKLLCSKEKDGKPMEGKSFPENVRGKTVDKATLKKACGKFKEIDVKML